MTDARNKKAGKTLDIVYGWGGQCSGWASNHNALSFKPGSEARWKKNGSLHFAQRTVVLLGTTPPGRRGSVIHKPRFQTGIPNY
jgi:hypothetical protein